MSHLSGTVPFSWEYTPGISKINALKSLTNVGCHDLVLPPKSKLKPKPKEIVSSSHYEISEERITIPSQPPCLFNEPPRRTLSKRFLWKVEEDDPFLEALKECTKNIVSDDGSKFYKYPVCFDCSKNKKSSGTSTSSWGTSFVRLFPKLMKSSKVSLSCKEVLDVEENNLSKPPPPISGYHLPIPKDIFQGLIKMQERLIGE